MPSGTTRAGAAKVVDLAQVSFPRLLFALLHQRFTGTITLDQPPPHAGSRTVWFDGGMPVFTDWASPDDVLGQVLAEMRIVPEPELVQALESLAQKGGLLGEELLRRGAIEHQKLTEAFRRQSFRKLARVFALTHGTVTATPGQHDLGTTLPKINVLELVLAGVGQSYDVPRIELELGAILRGPIAATAALARYHGHFRFRATDEPALRLISKGTRLDHLTSRGGITEKRAAQLVYTLWACQMLRTGAAASSASDSGTIAAPTELTRDPSERLEVAAATRPVAPPAAAAKSPNASPAAAAKSANASPAAAAKSSPPSPAAAAKSPNASPAAAAVVAEPIASSPTPDPEASSAAEFETELARFEAKLEAKAHAFDLLELPLDAGKRDVRRVWGELSRRFHPDALAARGLAHLRDRVNHVFAALSEAQMLLGDAEQRDKLRQSIERGVDASAAATLDPSAMARAAFESELIAKDADKLLRAGKFDKAYERYGAAAALTPNEPDIAAALLWCRYNLSARTRSEAAEAEKELGKLTAATPKLARGHYFHGMVLKDLGWLDAALQAFDRASQADPRLIDAERQARAIRLNRANPSPSPAPKQKPLFGIKNPFSGKK